MAVALTDDHVDCVFLLNKTLFMAMALCHVNCVSCFSWSTRKYNFGQIKHALFALCKLNYHHQHCHGLVDQCGVVHLGGHLDWGLIN
jgi:hypothetical protein